MLMPWTKRSAAAFSLCCAVALWAAAGACGPGRTGSRRRSPRKLTPLVYKQHVPNVDEYTLGASGRLETKLSRNHTGFKDLVPNYNPDILFKDEEGTGADRLMTQRCKEKLNTLAISVMNQWPGVKLRVTEAWDEEDLHAPGSLHYAGRAVDITTSDRDRSKYGMLARLAIDAGFDFVYYESRSHIHVSVKSESADAARTGGCFHGESFVQTPKGRCKMSELRVGDSVLVVDSTQSTFKFSKVIMFLDRDDTMSRLYRTIETSAGSRITLTPSHLLYASASNRSRDVSEGFVTFARDVEPGHFLFTSRSGSRVTMEEVTRVTASEEVGVFAPLTLEGNIVVNDVVASCYAVFKQQTLAHMAFAPVRIVDNFVSAVAHSLQKVRLKGTSRKSPPLQPKAEGIHFYPKLLYSVVHHLLPREYLYH